MATRKKPVAKKPTKISAAKKPTQALVTALAGAKESTSGDDSKARSAKAKSVKEKKEKSAKKDRKMNATGNDTSKKKMVRDSFTMPAPDYALIGVLKARTLSSGTAVKKSELLRAGLIALAAMSPAHLIDLVSAMPTVKTGRPGKKKK